VTEENIRDWWLYPEKFAENLYSKPTSSLSWDYLFMRTAKDVANQSKCSSRQVGAILVKNRNIISIGFNGSPRGSNLCQNREAMCPRKKLGFPSGQALELCPAQHAEENSIAMAAKHGISTDGATLYLWACQACQSCAGALINAGIKKLIHLEQDVVYDKMSSLLLFTAEIEVVAFKEEDILNG
jgi:dCMP deaminase